MPPPYSYAPAILIEREWYNEQQNLPYPGCNEDDGHLITVFFIY